VSPIDTVEAFLDAYFGADRERTMELVADDFEWISMSTPDRATKGREAMHTVVYERNFGFPEEFADGHHDTVRALCEGDTVMHERVDHFTMRGTRIDVPCCATFIVRDGRVATWHDYFDMGSTMRQMLAAGVELGGVTG
jgi:limonene-1,2-epoxide hydrolase